MRAETLARSMGGRWHGAYGTARCPAHDDQRPSLSMKDGDDGRLLLYCHGGCEFSDILAAIESHVGPDLLRTAPQDGARRRTARTTPEPID